MSATATRRCPLIPPARGAAWAIFSETPDCASRSLGELLVSAQAAHLDTAELSPQSQQAFYEEQLRQDDTDILDRQDTGTEGLQVLLESGQLEAQCRQAAKHVGIDSLLDRGYRLLSTGECHMLLLLREVLKQPDLLVVQQPFEGLDTRWRAAAEAIFAQHVQEGKRLALWVERLGDIPPCTTDTVLVRNAQATLHFAPDETLELEHWLALLASKTQSDKLALPPAPAHASPPQQPLLTMRDCSVHYLDDRGRKITQFEHLNWQLSPGEHTLILGPNGAGKSTLLQMLSGDHPQGYGNDLTIFGYQRGSGESIWDIKRNIGLVSPALHRDYRAGGNLLSVVVSGLYDSIGVYREIPEPDRRLGLRWLQTIGLGGNATQSFNSLSWGQQRLVLIARGLIKYPPLLILDEPTVGLDERGRQLVLAFLPRLARLQRTTLLMVTHREDEHLALFQRRLRFEPSDSPTVRFRIVVSSA